MNTESTEQRIVIVGGGAGGLELATRLGRRYKRDTAVQITLVDRAHTHLWKPLLHEVAAGTLNSNGDEVSYLAQAHWNHFNFRVGALRTLDRAAKTITIAASLDANGREYIPERVIPYDILVIAIGSVTNDFRVAGVAEHCFFLDGREQADTFHQHLIRACYEANSQPQAIKPGQLHIAIAGGGATGVELAAELHHSLNELVRFGLSRIDVNKDIRIHLVEGSARVLPGLPERVSRATHQILESMGISVHLNELITAADRQGFSTQSGGTVNAHIKVWAAGIKGADVLAKLDGLEVNRNGQLVVRPSLQTTQDDCIFALGDCAACRLPDSDQLVPPRAQAAHQQADLVSRSIERVLNNQAPENYVYKDFGSLINLSTQSAVGNLMGNLFAGRNTTVPIEGRIARLAYASLYRMHQVALHGVLRTGLTMVADWLTRVSKPRLKLH